MRQLKVEVQSNLLLSAVLLYKINLFHTLNLSEHLAKEVILLKSYYVNLVNYDLKIQSNILGAITICYY